MAKWSMTHSYAKGTIFMLVKVFKSKYNDVLQELIWNKNLFCYRHGDRTRAGATPCWPNDSAVWDCLLTSASIPVVKHDTHDITVDRIYRDGLCCSLPPPSPLLEILAQLHTFLWNFGFWNLPLPLNYPLTFLWEGGPGAWIISGTV